MQAAGDADFSTMVSISKSIERGVEVGEGTTLPRGTGLDFDDGTMIQYDKDELLAASAGKTSGGIF